jgi:hypothetical protein
MQHFLAEILIFNIDFLEMHYLTSAPETSVSDNLDRGKFRDHYTNEVIFMNIHKSCFAFLN